MTTDSLASDTGAGTPVDFIQTENDQLKRDIRFLEGERRTLEAQASMLRADLFEARRVVSILIQRLGGYASISEVEWSNADPSEVTSTDDPTGSTMTLVYRPV